MTLRYSNPPTIAHPTGYTHVVEATGARTFYISGTHGMTVAFRKALTTLGVPITAIRTDFFPGFA